MVIREFWIQYWDTNPNDINRITGERIEQALKVPLTLHSPVTGLDPLDFHDTRAKL